MNNKTQLHLNLTLNKDNHKRQNDLIDAVFQDYSKVLAIRLDFYIKSSYEEFNNKTFMDFAFVRLRNYMRFNSLFNHYITHITKLEYGNDRKWHYHVLFLFDGQKIKDDYHLAQQIGEYWTTTITRNIGEYYSANMNAKTYKYFTLGMIKYYESERIAAFKEAASYLTKEMDIGKIDGMQDAAGKAYRSYRPGIYKPKTHLLGRPRKYES